MLAAARFAELITAILTLISRMHKINLDLVKQIAAHRRARPVSEKLRRLERQLSLPLVGLENSMRTPASADAPQKPRREPRAKGQNGGRRLPPANWVHKDMHNLVPPEQRKCPDCGDEMKTVGYSESEYFEVIPAQIFVYHRKDERVSCPKHHTIVSAVAPPRIAPGGILGDTLIVEAVADKYLDKLPIERQANRFKHAGVPIAPQTLGRSVAAAIDWVAPIARAIVKETRASELLATDATGLPVLDQDHPLGVRNGTMWCWVGDNRWVSFFYSPIGDSDSVKKFLEEDLCRTVQCDGTNVLSFLERAGGKRPGCWSHARHRLVAAARSGEALALVGLEKIARLFEIERLARMSNDTAEQRFARRREQSAPALDELLSWVNSQRKIVPPKSLMGKALGYLHRQWKRLTLFLEDGRIELTNNRVERELRSLVIGRKNWLFAYGDLGGRRAAQILTIIGSCIAHQVNPRAYLHTVIRLIINGFPNHRLRELLPDRITEAHPELGLPKRGPPALPEDSSTG